MQGHVYVYSLYNAYIYIYMYIRVYCMLYFSIDYIVDSNCVQFQIKFCLTIQLSPQWLGQVRVFLHVAQMLPEGRRQEGAGALASGHDDLTMEVQVPTTYGWI